MRPLARGLLARMSGMPSPRGGRSDLGGLLLARSPSVTAHLLRLTPKILWAWVSTLGHIPFHPISSK
jgi:hypothetical protein